MKNVINIEGAPIFPVVSLFSGAMGLDLGLIDAGLHVAVSQDYEKWCVETIRKNGHVAVEGDIRELIKADPKCDFLLEPAKLKKEAVFAVVGGPRDALQPVYPCHQNDSATLFRNGKCKRFGIDAF